MSSGILTRRTLIGVAAAQAAALAGAKAAPGKSNTDLRVGFYSGFFQAPFERHADENEAILKKMASAGLRIYDSKRIAGKNVEDGLFLVKQMQRHGLTMGVLPAVKFKNPEIWFNGQAESELRALAPLDGQIFDIYLGHEVFEWAPLELRNHIVEMSKRILPRTKTRMYFAHLDLPQLWEKQGAASKSGRPWKDFEIRPTEKVDILHFSIGGLSQPASEVIARYEEGNRILRKLLPEHQQYVHVNARDEDMTSPHAGATLATVRAYLEGRGVLALLLRFIADDKTDGHPSDASIAAIGRVLGG